MKHIHDTLELRQYAQKANSRNSLVFAIPDKGHEDEPIYIFPMNSGNWASVEKKYLAPQVKETRFRMPDAMVVFAERVKSNIRQIFSVDPATICMATISWEDFRSFYSDQLRYVADAYEWTKEGTDAIRIRKLQTHQYSGLSWELPVQVIGPYLVADILVYSQEVVWTEQYPLNDGGVICRQRQKIFSGMTTCFTDFPDTSTMQDLLNGKVFQVMETHDSGTPVAKWSISRKGVSYQPVTRAWLTKVHHVVDYDDGECTWGGLSGSYADEWRDEWCHELGAPTAAALKDVPLSIVRTHSDWSQAWKLLMHYESFAQAQAAYDKWHAEYDRCCAIRKIEAHQAAQAFAASLASEVNN